MSNQERPFRRTPWHERESWGFPATVTLMMALVTLGSNLPSGAACAEEMELAVDVISEIGSERATSGSGAKIISVEGRTHVVWQEATSKGYFNLVRTLDHATGAWSEPFTLNRGKDNHARPVMAVDRQGFVHIVLSGHGSPVTYRRSVRPHDTSEFTPEEKTGDGTYPVLLAGSNGELYMTIRSAQRWNGVDLYIKPADGPWQYQNKLVLRDPKLPGYAGFASGMAWGPGQRTLHMVVDFYESKETYKLRGVHQAVCYLRSDDFGRTWNTADGTPIKLPARPPALDTLAEDTGERHASITPPVILAQGNIAADSQGMPHVLYISHLENAGQVMHATTNKAGEWVQTPVDAIAKAFPDLRPVGCRGGLTIGADDTLYGLLELVPLGPGWVGGKPSRGLVFAPDQKRLVWIVSRDGGKTFSAELALPVGKTFHEPNVQRPNGFSGLQVKQYPAFVYFDGESRYPKKNEVLQNNVFFVQGR